MPEKETKITLVQNGPVTKLSLSGRAFRRDLKSSWPRIRSYMGSMQLKKYDADLASEFFPIHPDFDTGIRVINEHGTLYESQRRDPDKLREARLDVSDMLYSIGAQHYYSKIEIESSNFVALRDNPNETRSRRNPATCEYDQDHIRKGDVNCTFGAWLSEAYKKRELERIRIEIERPLTRHDFKNARDFGVDRLKHYKLGDPTHGFWTPKEALDAAIEFFKKSFAPGWILTGTYHYAKDNDEGEEIEIRS